MPSTSAIRTRSRSCSTRVWAEHGRLDILVNSAGGQFPQAAIDFSVKGWNAVVNTNLNGTWFMMQAAAQRWRDAKQPGSIVNIVVVTTRGLYGVAHSVAARAGVIGAQPQRGGRMGAARHPRQLHRAGRDRDRRLEGLRARGARRAIRAPTRCCAPAAPGRSPRPASISAVRPRSSSPANCSPSMAAASSGARPGPPASPTISAKEVKCSARLRPVRCGERARSGSPASLPRKALPISSSAPLQRYTVGFSWVTYGFRASWRDGAEQDRARSDPARRSRRTASSRRTRRRRNSSR